MQAAKPYLSYHGMFNVSGSPVHYAVVPYQADSSVAYQVALRTLLVAALHNQEKSQQGARASARSPQAGLLYHFNQQPFVVNFRSERREMGVLRCF